MWHRLDRLGLRRWLPVGRDDRDSGDNNRHHQSHHGRNHEDETAPHHTRASSTDSKHNNLARRLSRKVPRSTFKRRNSEHRDRLTPLKPQHRRALSVDRHPVAQSSPPPAVGPRSSAPEVQWLGPSPVTTVEDTTETNNECLAVCDPCADVTTKAAEAVEVSPTSTPTTAQDTLEMELEQRWILNLSMHFRDRSEREKFFVTYAETPTRWRRVTISCDYRRAPPDSLEQDLRELRYQRDKCARIYESIRESLPEIQFYDTVTNLKVETVDGRLHVHVTEDMSEHIQYPPISSIGHLRGARCVPEHLLHFDSHLSGFVYKVRLDGRAYIKKEIPGPDSVDEFLYEINALHALNGAPNVIQVEALVVDERQEKVKGLLINYAEQGALVDILYEHRGEIAFERREAWAKQIVRGLCEIHESGYVQGDFTLSNIVVDAFDNVHIIDINRRGCPVGWEPPEISAKIESNQRISMYIGVKTDLYQLGMTLWALGMEEDEPERQPRPLFIADHVHVPEYYRRLVHICLSPSPRHRLSAKELLMMFPPEFQSDLPATLPSFSKNGTESLPLTATDHLAYKYSFDPSVSGRQQYAAFLPKNGDQDQQSMPTSSGYYGARFPSAHSSTSTLHHEEPHFALSTAESALGDNLKDADNTIQIAALANAVRNERDQQALLPRSDSKLEKPALENMPIPNGQKLPSKSDQGHLPIASSNPAEITGAVQDDQTCQVTEDSIISEATPNLSRSTPSLFYSVLPINPAFSVCRRSLPLEKTNTASEEPPNRSKSVYSLRESLLPINPAFKQ